MKYSNMILGMHGSMYGKPYAKAFQYLLDLRRRNKLGDKYDALLDAIRTTFVFDEIGAKWNEVWGNGDLWNPLMISVERSPGLSGNVVLSAATIAGIEEGAESADFKKQYHAWGNRYAETGFPKDIEAWLRRDIEIAHPYEEASSNTAVRVGPIGYLGLPLSTLSELAIRSASVTHSRASAIQGAITVTQAISMVRNGKGYLDVADELLHALGVRSRKLPEGNRYKFGYDCRETVRIALSILKHSDNAEELMQNVIRVGYDTDTVAMIVGSIYGATGDVPEEMRAHALANLSDEIRILVSEEKVAA